MDDQKMIDVRIFGARGDGITLDTAALQAALDHAAAQPAGATVALRGGVFLSGALFLHSGVTLWLAPDATLLGSRDVTHYPRRATRVAGIEMLWPAALVNIVDAERVAVRGSGCIDGDGAGCWAAYWALREAYAPRGLRWAADYDAERMRLVLVQNACDVFIGGGLRLRRAGFWTLQLLYSRCVRVQDLQIRNNEDGRGPSTDGVDIDSSERVLLRRLDIAVNDDAIALKAGRDHCGLRVNRPVRNVLVADCTVREGSTGIAFGSETSGGFERVRVRRLRVQAPVPVGLLVKSARTRGGFARDIRVHDLQLQGVTVALRITLDWNPAYSRAVLPAAEAATAPAHWRTLAAPVPPAQGLMQLQSLRIERLRVRDANTAFEIDADARAPIGQITLQDCDIEAYRGGHLLDVQQARFIGSRLHWQQPLVLHRREGVQGLPEALMQIDPACPRRDVSAMPAEAQDVL